MEVHPARKCQSLPQCKYYVNTVPGKERTGDGGGLGDGVKLRYSLTGATRVYATERAPDFSFLLIERGMKTLFRPGYQFVGLSCT